MPIVGTAGHVDHGKSTLVQALTGRDPDRWAEEKTRGLTIDLGFAWTVLDDATEVGFVDVPGHERFIKNMLAGVGALDVALFVVAADEGWMPQSEEHLAVLDLLEVGHGVIAVTRVDLVDDDLVELAILDVDEHITGTTLERWPIVPVSAVSGQGMEELRAALRTAVTAAGPPADLGRPRMWVDRAFVISGAGVVVTGTLTGGTITRDTDLEIWPGGRRARVRAIQSHEHTVDIAHPGSRTAINLAGVDLEDVARGSLLCLPGAGAPGRRLLIDVRLVRTAEEPLTERGAYHLHAGTGAWPVTLRPVAGDTITERGPALVTLPEALAFEMGDRVVVREVGRRTVIAGGRVLDPAPAGRLDALAAAAADLRAAIDAAPDERASALLEVRGRELTTVLAAHSGGGHPATAVIAGRSVISPHAFDAIASRAASVVAAYQQSNPLRPGMPKAELASSLGIESDLVAAVADRSDVLVDEGATLHTPDFAGGWGPDQEAEWVRVVELLESEGLAVPRAATLGLEPEAFHALVREGRLIRVADDLVYLPEQIDQITTRLAGLDDGFTVAQFRDSLGLSRRQAVPLLEWLDAEGWTSRRGDVRIVRRRREPGSSDAPTP